MQHADWILIVLIVLLLYWILSSIRKARRGHLLYVRRIPGIDAIDDAIGRATEMGRPVMYTMGEASLQAMELYASLGILSYVADRTARMGVRLIMTTDRAETYPMIEEPIREAYRAAERIDAFRDDDVRFLSTDHTVYAMMTAALVEDENVASAFFLGLFWFTSLLMTEPGARRGVIQIAGDSGPFQIPFFIASCDYVIIGEELFAASAYVSGDPTIKGSLVAQDRFKFLLLAVAMGGVLLLTLNVILTLATGRSLLEDNPLFELFMRYH
jgi:hypothetical protein